PNICDDDRMSKKKLILSSAFLLPALVGCGKAGAPECGDEMTFDLVRSIIQRELGAAVLPPT
ncbi:TPA: hypothetical protein ACOECO_004231, partial [Stenotrophomonas maltophilia]